MSMVIAWLQEHLGLSVEMQARLLASVLAVAVFWLIHRTVLLLVFRRMQDAAPRYRVRKISTYATVFSGILIVGRIWFEGFGSLATFLGLLSAGIAIALKDLFVNLAGWLFILWRRPFEVGDRVEIGEFAGDVIDVRIFQFSLMEIGRWVEADQSTGRVLHVPNGVVLSSVTANYTKGFEYIWNEIPVVVTFESDWRKAKQLLREIADRYGNPRTEPASRGVQRASMRFLISYTVLTPTVYTSVVDHGVRLTLRYLCGPRERRGTSEAIWEDILDAFAECRDIDFAYPTQRYFHNVLEGKPEARAHPDN